jgi:hypothetical protein
VSALAVVWLNSNAIINIESLLMNIITIKSLIIAGICVTACLGKIIDDCPAKTKAMTLSIEETIKEHSEELMSIPGIVGVGQGLCDNKPCIKIYIIKRTPELDSKIPGLLDGYEVSIEITGEIRAHPDN